MQNLVVILRKHLFLWENIKKSNRKNNKNKGRESPEDEKIVFIVLWAWRRIERDLFEIQWVPFQWNSLHTQHNEKQQKPTFSHWQVHVPSAWAAGIAVVISWFLRVTQALLTCI